MVFLFVCLFFLFVLFCFVFCLFVCFCFWRRVMFGIHQWFLHQMITIFCCFVFLFFFLYFATKRNVSIRILYFSFSGKHRCKKCSDGKGTLLPKFCFCDKKVQCKLSKKDAIRKYNCTSKYMLMYICMLNYNSLILIWLLL